MKVFVGTSGWLYSWNEGGSLDWYLKNSGLNAVELNFSFYRFPFPNQVKSWKEKGKNLRWAVKVNRLITHQFKFNERAQRLWQRFFQLFTPMDDLIDFYLCQLPPNFSPKERNRLERFILPANLGSRCALEVRHSEWFSEENYRWAKEMGVTWVAIDSPEFPRDIIKTSEAVYLRLHGRSGWYSHDYSKRELEEIAERIILVKPKRVFIFFNNDQAMLENAQVMRGIFQRIRF